MMNLVASGNDQIMKTFFVLLLLFSILALGLSQCVGVYTTLRHVHVYPSTTLYMYVQLRMELTVSMSILAAVSTSLEF